MRQLCEDSKEAGIRTLVALDEQGEQLDRVEEDMDKINTDMKEAEKALSGMEQCCGLCTCPCNKSKEFQEDESTWKGNDDGKVIGGQPVRTVDDRGGGMMMTGNYIAKVTKDAREDEMEENMQEVNTMIGNLRNMAIDMGSEIGAQNAQIGRINQKVMLSLLFVLHLSNLWSLYFIRRLYQITFVTIFRPHFLSPSSLSLFHPLLTSSCIDLLFFSISLTP